MGLYTQDLASSCRLLDPGQEAVVAEVRRDVGFTVLRNFLQEKMWLIGEQGEQGADPVDNQIVHARPNEELNTVLPFNPDVVNVVNQLDVDSPRGEELLCLDDTSRSFFLLPEAQETVLHGRK